MLILTIAYRFARSLRARGFARFTTMVSIFSVSLGCVALIVALSVLNGYEEMIEKTATQFTAHLEIRPVLDPLITESDISYNDLARIPGVAGVDRVINREALVRTRTGMDGIVLSGVSSQRANAIINPLVVSGLGVSEKGAVVGEGLANSMKLAIGDTMVVYSSKADDSQPIIVAIPVAGILRSGMAVYDNSLVAMPIDWVRQRISVDSSAATSLLITCTNIEKAESTARFVRELLGNRFYVTTFRDQFQAMSAWIDLQKRPIPIILGLISIVAVFTVVSTLLIAVVEKTRSIAILIAIGITPLRIMLIFLLRSISIGAVGATLGTGFAFAILWMQSAWHIVRLDGAIYYVSELPVSFSAGPFIVVPAVSIALCALVALVPMVIASRVRPTAALRFAF